MRKSKILAEPEPAQEPDSVIVRWTTHNPRGLSAMDIEMAWISDWIAEDLGEIRIEEQPQFDKEQEQQQQPS